MADIEADPNQSSLDGESGVTNKEKLADSTTQDLSSSDGKNEDTNGVVVSSTSSFGSSQNSSGVSSTQTLSSPLIPPSRLTFCRPTPSLAGLGASKMMPNPFAPKGSLKSDMVSSASVSTPSSEGILTPSRFGLSRQPGPDSTNVKSAGFKSGPLLAPSKFGVQSTQNIHSLIKPATLPDPTNKTSVDKEQTEKSDADSSSSNPTSEASKEVISSDNTTATNQLEVGNISSTTAPSHNDSNSPSKFTPPAFSRLSENNENKVTSLAGGKDSTDGAAVSSTPSSNSKEFVFGTNLHQRVVGFDDNSKKNNNCSGFVFGEKIGGRAMAAEKTPSPPPSDHRLANSSEETNTPNFKSVAFKPGPLLTPSRFSVQSTQNIHSLIKPATLPDPTNKTSVDKEQTEKSDADSSSSNPTSEASKEVISSDNTTATNQLEVGNISSTTAPSHNDSNSPSKFTPPAFSRLSENNENKVTSLAGGKDSTDGAAVSSTPSSNSKEFVFGTNLHQRVVGFDDNSKKNNNCSGFVFGEKIGGRAMAAEKTPSPPPSDHRLANSSEETNTPNFKSVAFKPGPLLTPSRFSIQSSQNVHNLIKPATLPDPTNKEQSEKSDADSSSKPLSEASDHTSTNNSRLEAGSISSTTATGQNNSNSPKFTPPAFSSSNIPNTSSLGVKDSTDIGSVSSTPSSSRGEFLFGTNLHQRVVGIGDNSKKNNNCSGFVFGENLANRVVAAEKTSSPSSSEPCLTNSADEINTTEKQCQSLEESAREYQAKHGVRPEYKEIEVKTGEEDESNVLQCNCKLFVFDKPTQMWIERGCGVLRLNDLAGNDSEKFQSRIVMRSQGSLRVILNTKIWTGMTVERASQKTVRITAADGDGVKVFLIAANPKDIDNIFRAIDWRIQQLKTEEEEEEEEKRGGTEKRKSESQDWISPNKKLKKLSELSTSTSSGESKSVPKEESDSSVLDPETEASNESYTSSQTVRSESD